MKLSDLKDYTVVSQPTLKLSDLGNDFKVVESGTQQETPVATEKTFLQKAAGVTDAIFGGGKVGEAIGTEIAKARATPEERQFIDEGPSNKEVIGSALQAASLFIPVGRVAKGITTGAKALGLTKGVSAIGKVGSGALAGESFDIASNLQQNKEGADILTPGAGAGIGAAIPGLGVAKNVAVRFGEAQAPRIINSLIKPLAKDFSYGKDPGRAVAELKIVANNFDDLVTKIRESRQTIGQEIGSLGRKLSTKPIVDIGDSLMPLDEAMRTAASQNNPTLLSRLANVKKSINSILEPMVDDAGNIGIKEVGKRKLNGLTFSEARDVLGDIGDITQFTGNPSDDKIVNSALKQIYGNIKQSTLAVADSLEPTLAKDFRKLTERYADLSSAEIATKYRDKIVQRSSLVGLSPQIAGIGSGLITMVATGGATTPAVLAGITGAIVDKLAQTPGFKTRLAAILSKKAPQEVSSLFKQIPVLQRIFPKGGAVSPGDRILDEIDSLPNKQGGFIKIGGVTTKAIDEPTKRELQKVVDYIDFERSNGVNQNMEEMIGFLAEKFGVTSKNYRTVANQFEKLIEKTKTIEKSRAVLKKK